MTTQMEINEISVPMPPELRKKIRALAKKLTISEAGVVRVNHRQLKQTACLYPTPPGAGETSGLVDEQPSLSKSCLERRTNLVQLSLETS